MKLLLVEDEIQLSNIVTKGLKKCGYAVDVAYDGQEALYFYDVNQYDLVILDINLPKINGFEVLQEIRNKDKFARILMLSARSAVDDKVKGLDIGANDYVTKPFDFLELEARIRNLLRTEFATENMEIVCGELILDITSKTLKTGIQTLEFTGKEYGIMEFLMINKEKVVSGETILEHVWNSEADLFSNTLKYHIHTIKKKLKEANVVKANLKNIRSRGYMLTETGGVL